MLLSFRLFPVKFSIISAVTSLDILFIDTAELDFKSKISFFAFIISLSISFSIIFFLFFISLSSFFLESDKILLISFLASFKFFSYSTIFFF